MQMGDEKLKNTSSVVMTKAKMHFDKIQQTAKLLLFTG